MQWLTVNKKATIRKFRTVAFLREAGDYAMAAFFFS
nr:MAG TPA: hypothetical protein [Caudoviricetes sp.]